MIGGNFSLTNSGGQNTTTIEDSSVTGSVTVNAGKGFNSQCGNCWNDSRFNDANEIFTLSVATIGDNVTVSNVSGETTTDIETSLIGNNLTVTNGNASYGNCGFHSSSASAAGDLLTLNNSTVGNNVAISNDSDGNTTNVENSSVSGTLAVSNLVGTASQSCFNSSCSENLAAASDTFDLNGSSVGTNVTVSNISDGADTSIDSSSITGLLSVNNGVGSYGQCFTSCRGQSSANFGDLLTMAGSSVGATVTITNGSTYNSTDIESSTTGDSVTVNDGLNYATKTTNSCGNNSCGNNQCGNNQCGNNSGCGNSCGGQSQQVYTTDLFTLNASALGNNLSVSNASGYTNTDIESSAVANAVAITDANGTAYFEMDLSVVGNNLIFSAGSGYTDVDITGSMIANNATISVNSGATVVIAPSQVGGALVVS